jgi:plastocyanin
VRAARRFPFRLQVTAKEFYYTLSSRTAPAGAAVIQFVNYGEDPHDMRVQRVGGGRLYKTPVMQPGAYTDLSVHLVPGHYLLWCSIANHRQLGMQATLVVK